MRIVFRQIRTDVVAAVPRGILAGEHRAAGRGANRIDRVGTIEGDAARRKPVKIGRFDRWVQAPNAVPPLLITSNQEDVHAPISWI